MSMGIALFTDLEGVDGPANADPSPPLATGSSKRSKAVEDAEGINRSADALFPVRFRFLGLDNDAVLPENAGPRSGGVGEALEDEEAPEVRVAESLLFVEGV